MDRITLSYKEVLYLYRRIDHEADRYKKMLDDGEDLLGGRVTIDNPDPHLLMLLGPQEGQVIEAICLEWEIADVKFVRPDLTREECSDVLQAVKDNHDASMGVSWDNLEFEAEEFYPLSESEQAQVEKFKEDIGDWAIGDSFNHMDEIWKKSGLKVRVAPLQPPSGGQGEPPLDAQGLGRIVHLPDGREGVITIVVPRDGHVHDARWWVTLHTPKLKIGETLFQGDYELRDGEYWPKHHASEETGEPKVEDIE